MLEAKHAKITTRQHTLSSKEQYNGTSTLPRLRAKRYRHAER